jgi:5-methylcytosine-specific restriction endonuclease McrA
MEPILNRRELKKADYKIILFRNPDNLRSYAKQFHLTKGKIEELIGDVHYLIKNRGYAVFNKFNLITATTRTR